MANDTHPMTADDLTRLRAEFDEILTAHERNGGRLHTDPSIAVRYICKCGEVVDDHRAHVATVLASSPTVAALIDRVERAERERDRLAKAHFTGDSSPAVPEAQAALRDAASYFWNRPTNAILTKAVTALVFAELNQLADEHERRSVASRVTGTPEDANADPFTPADLGQIEGADDGQ